MANNLKISFTGEIIRRWKETTNLGKDMFYVAVKVPRGEYTDIFRCTAKDVDSVKPFAVSSKVDVEAFVGGREWKNESTGKVSYFTDLRIYSIKAHEEPVTAPAAADSADADDVDEIPF